MNKMKKIVVGLVLISAMAGQALAGVLVGSTPAQAAAGQQSDGNSLPYSQAFAAPLSSVLESITWWGYYITEPGVAPIDNFEVTLDGEVQTGDLSIIEFGNYFQYTLDVDDAPLTSLLLSIVNGSTDFEWYWQSAQAQGGSGPDADAVAFSLNGYLSELTPTQAVPEPETITMVLAGLGLLGWSVRRRASRD